MTWPERPQDSEAASIPVIVVINIVIFFLWNISPAFIDFMRANFTVSWSALAEGRIWVLLTSVFSHNLTFHILLNMIVLISFGPPLERLLGLKKFILFFLTAGLVSSLSHAMVSHVFLSEPTQAALGASGAIAGLILMFALIFPEERIYIFGLIPIPALWGAGAFIAIDIWGLIAQAGGGGLPIGHGAHLGGAATGIVYYFIWKASRSRPHRRLRSAWS